MHEDLLRHIWAKQLFDTSRLATTDGRAVRILKPGILHRGSGPDFRNAAVEIGGILFTGDIEFHRSIDDWELHRHHTDPNYNSVILHVVLNGPAYDTPSHSGRVIPTIILAPLLLSPIESIRDQLSREEYHSRRNPIACAGKNENVSGAVLQEWIRTLYGERLREKTAQYYDRLCDIIVHHKRMVGEPRPPYNDVLDPNDIPLPDASFDKEWFRQKLPWEQLLYEQMMDGLGYANNRAPMKRLTERLPLLSLVKQRWNGFTSHHIEAALFMISGLLPSLKEVNDMSSRVHLHSLSAAWTEIPPLAPISPLHHAEWSFSPTRPSNFPTIRIAAAGVLVHKILFGSLFHSLITLVGGQFSSPHSKIDQLLHLLEPGDHPFWNFHFSFTEATHRKHAILGESRKNDIIINTIIPFVCLYATVFGKKELTEHSLNIAVAMPPLEENIILRAMERQLVGKKLKIDYAYQQQGLLQLNRRYCIPERCKECAVGKVVF